MRCDSVKLNGIANTSLYSRAPIREVIFDVRVVGGLADVWELADGFQAVRERYPNRSEIIGGNPFDFGLASETNPAFETGPSLVGLRYASADGVRQFEARTDGFSFNHVSEQQGDYGSWEQFLSEVRKVWEIYANSRAPEFVTRLALRYINQFDLDHLGQTHDEPLLLSDYFAFRPLWDGDKLGDAGGFQTRMAFRQDNDAVLLISQETAPQEKRTVVLLDIDTFFDALRLSAGGREIWNKAQELRDVKNRAFEACLTDKTRELIR